jgi:hypothetical protein
MVRIDVGDQNVVEIALMRLLAGMGQEPGGIELLDRHAATAIGKKIHESLPRDDEATEAPGLIRKTKRRTEGHRRSARLTRFRRKSHTA